MEVICVNESLGHPSNASTPSINHIINDIALPAVCAFGIVGNILNLTILTRRKLQKSFRLLEQAANLCLIALAVSDLMFCVLAILFTFTPSDNVYEGQGVIFFYGMYSYFFINVFIMESTMLTVAMSLERYLAICFPLRQDLYLTTRRIKYVIVSTFIFSLLFNIPVIWRFEAIPICSNSTLGETPSLNLSLANSSFQTTSHQSFGPFGNATGGNTIIESQQDFVHQASSLLSSSSSSSSALSPSYLSPSSSSSSSSKFPAAASSDTLTSSESLLRAASKHLLSQINATYSPVTLSSSSSSSSSTSSHSTQTPLSLSSSSPPLSSSSSSSSSPVRYKIQVTPGKQTEKLAYRIAWAIVGNVIPLILLFFFNVCLCRKIYLSYKMRRQFKRQSRSKSSSHILTLTLVVIVVMFFILVAPSELLLLVSDTSTTVEPILNFMQSLNFSVNFILYCIISPHFRKTLKYIFMCGCYNIYQVSRDWKKEFETSLM